MFKCQIFSVILLHAFNLSIFQHFLDFITKDYVEDISSIPLEYLQEADVRLVLIGPAPYKFIPVSKLDQKRESSKCFNMNN